ncbi:MAG TPA: sugar phosphate isomerase/epimerase family protein [Geobacteraceae bacterium]
MSTNNKEIFAHVPYPFIRDNLPLILERRINPELFFPADVLDSFIPEELAAIAGALAQNGLKTTIHGPFMDLNPGSAEPLLRKATISRFHRAMDAAAILKPRVIVLHPGYDKWRYGGMQQTWLGFAVDTFREMAARAQEIGCTIAVENIFEEEPSTLRALLEALDSPFVRHCFDVGHWNLFARVGLEEWFAELGGFIAETHIHDNRGERDDHAPLGEGEIDFELFFGLMERYAPDATWTIEAHSREALERSLVNIERYRSPR